mmetsp:Transcript_19615/g.54042  ORF Transcript_19615/g.54042 Transcript_19615/m.54042 type:complete len:87 (-) Transcript_19615:318-578(-)
MWTCGLSERVKWPLPCLLPCGARQTLPRRRLRNIVSLAPALVLPWMALLVDAMLSPFVGADLMSFYKGDGGDLEPSDYMLIDDVHV